MEVCPEKEFFTNMQRLEPRRDFGLSESGLDLEEMRRMRQRDEGKEELQTMRDREKKLPQGRKISSQQLQYRSIILQLSIIYSL